MAVKIFGRKQFEKAMNFFPLGFKLVGANGQLEYQAPVATKLTCTCGVQFYPVPGYESAQCPSCGKVEEIPSKCLVAGEVFIKIYSSIDPHTGLSRDTGRDSIRMVLVAGDGEYIYKEGVYITRVKGWETRLKDKARELWGVAKRAPRCKKGHKASLYRCGSGANKGATFWKCPRCNDWLRWERRNWR